MTDRELLELAAKAAGLVNPRYVSETSWGTGISHGTCDQVYVIWNPLTNDGDALRLAVKLRISVFVSNRKRAPSTSAFDGRVSVVVPHGEDARAATRRAIVRAAAEIGKEMS